MSSEHILQVFRKSDSYLVCPVWEAIEDTPDSQCANFDYIAKQLAISPRALSEYDSVELLDHLVDDGLIVLNPATKAYTLPELGKKKQPWNILKKRDCYCYECHTPGSVLSCADCPRVFHVGCIRPDSEEDLPLLPFAEPVPQLIQNTFFQVYGSPYHKIYGENASSTKRISAESHRKCINCRLRQLNMYRLRDNSMLNSLLEMHFKYIRSWVANDTFSEQEYNSIHIKVKYIKMLSPVLFQNLFTVNDIARKIAAGQYASLVEFQCDILDVKHCIGILRGVECPEYEAAKYLLLDALHGIKEMAMCQDCFRHSSIKDDDKWFIKPCQPPHELVYAKQTGYTFWPAKVMRRTDGMVDVRFFGGCHSRADIPLKNIRPIYNKPPMKRSSLLDRAMQEFAAHRQILAKSKIVVTHSKIEHTEAAKRASRASDSESSNWSSTTRQKRRKRNTRRKRNISPVDSSSDSQSDSDTMPISRLNPQENVTNVDTSSFNIPPVGQPYIQNLLHSMKGCPQLWIDMAVNEFRMYTSVLQEERNMHALELSEAKLQHFCYRCLKPSNYYCCLAVTYCSIQCQMADWESQHSPMCYRLNRKSALTQTDIEEDNHSEAVI